MLEHQQSQLSEAIVTRAWTDEAFKQALLQDPKTTLAEELGVTFPAEVEVEAVEETALVRYLVLPHRLSRRQMLKTVGYAAGAAAVAAAGLTAWFSLAEDVQARALAPGGEAFKQELLQQPKAALYKAYGLETPDFVEVKTLAETARKRYVVVPFRSQVNPADLSDENLEAVAAGARSSAGQFEDFGPPDVSAAC
jgi:hypothetical protein